MYVRFFAGRNGTLYGIHNVSGQLDWVRHQGFSDGSATWANGGTPRVVGTGWMGIPTIIGGSADFMDYHTASNEGVIYATHYSGTLRWYRHTGHETGDNSWANSGNSMDVGTGWNSGLRAAADGGVIYKVQGNDLLWYKHTGYLTGANAWEGPKVIGTGWGKVTWIGASSGGVLYARWEDGTLWYYKHLGYKDGTNAWEPSVRVGEGWSDFRFIAATNDRVLYTVDQDGSVSWYRNDVEGTRSWQIKKGIGSGFAAPLPTPDFLIDGTTYFIKAKSNGKYLCRDAQTYIANRDSASTWEKFTLIRYGADWRLVDYKGDSMGYSTDFEIDNPAGLWPASGNLQWELEHVSGNDYALKQSHRYITAEPSGVLFVDREERQDWETFTFIKA